MMGRGSRKYDMGLVSGGNMSTRLQNTLRIIGKQIHDWKIPQLPAFHSNQQTKLTWARIIDSYDNVPEVYQEFYKPHRTKDQAFPYSVLVPAYETFSYKVTEKVICMFQHEIQILERSGNALATQCYPIAGISYVETSSMLLDSRIQINGVTSQGMPASSVVRFSTATDYVFRPILSRIRLYPTAPDSSGRDSEAFDHWMHLNYKFMNLARNSLVQGEKVICAILQPEIRREIFTILGKTYFRTISPTHASILTDRELILIREEVLQSREDKYGGIWEYIPVNKIAALSTSRKNEHLLALSVQMLTDERFECLFPASRKNEVEQLLNACMAMKLKSSEAVSVIL